MNWYKLVKTASPQNKIRALGATDPYSQAFIYKYEDVIPWQNVKSIQDLHAHIDRLVSGLNKDIDNMPNKESRTILNNWKQLILGWALHHNSNTYLIYLVMKPLVDWAKSHTAPPPAAMPDVVMPILKEMVRHPNQSINFLKQYMANMSPTPKEEGWHLFPKGSDPNDLYLFAQGSGWCLSTEQYSRDYIEAWDIWIYAENNMPVVAVTVGDDKEVNEVRGRFNELPYKYSSIIEKKAIKEKWDRGESSFYSFTVGVPKVVKALSKDPNNQTALSYFGEYLQEDEYPEYRFDVYDMLPKEIKELPVIKNKVIEQIKDIMQDAEPYNMGLLFKGMSDEIKIDMAPEIANIINEEINTGEAIEIEGLPRNILDLLNVKKLTDNYAQYLVQRNRSVVFIPDSIFPNMTDEELVLISASSGNLSTSGWSTERKEMLGPERMSHINQLMDKKNKRGIQEKIDEIMTAYRDSSWNLQKFFSQTTIEERKNLLKYFKGYFIANIEFKIKKAIAKAVDKKVETVTVPIELEKEAENALNNYFNIYGLDETDVKPKIVLF